MSNAGPATRVLRAVGVDTRAHQHPFAWLAERLDSHSLAFGVLFGAYLGTLWVAANVTPEGSVLFDWVVLGGLLAVGATVLTGEDRARIAARDTTPYEPPEPGTRTVAGEIERVLRPRDVASSTVSDDLRRRSQGHTVAVVAVEPDAVSGVDRLRRVLPGFTPSESVAVLLSPEANVEQGDAYEGCVREATIEKTVGAHVPVADRTGEGVP